MEIPTFKLSGRDFELFFFFTHADEALTVQNYSVRHPQEGNTFTLAYSLSHSFDVNVHITHQNGVNMWSQWLPLCHNCWCQTAGFGYFWNCWYPGIVTHDSLSSVWLRTVQKKQKHLEIGISASLMWENRETHLILTNYESYSFPSTVSWGPRQVPLVSAKSRNPKAAPQHWTVEDCKNVAWSD